MESITIYPSWSHDSSPSSFLSASLVLLTLWMERAGGISGNGDEVVGVIEIREEEGSLGARQEGREGRERGEEEEGVAGCETGRRGRERGGRGERSGREGTNEGGSS